MKICRQGNYASHGVLCAKTLCTCGPTEQRAYVGPAMKRKRFAHYYQTFALICGGEARPAAGSSQYRTRGFVLWREKSINRICEKMAPFQHVCGRRRVFSSRTKSPKPESGGTFDSSRRAKCNINMFALIIIFCRTAQQMIKKQKIVSRGRC